MKHIFLLLFLLLSTPAHAGGGVNENLQFLTPFIGTWKAEIAENTYDVTHYDWILGGKALRIMHSVNDGDYGGEALVHWNEEKQAITYRYVTTAAFYTEGTISPTPNGFEAHETVHGSAGSITESRAGYEMKDGEIHSWSQFRKDGEWTDKSKATYLKAAEAEVKF